MHANMSESKVNKMIGKKQLIAFTLVALTVFGVLNLGTLRLSAYTSPAIYISPAYVSSPCSAAGTNYTFSVLTDYDGSDVWGFEFDLTYNPDVLECREVVNGSLIRESVGATMWDPGTFNNTEGTLVDVGNAFAVGGGGTPTVTSGPGTMANITFTVVGYGISNITFVGSKTKLIGAHEVGGEWEQFNIIDDSMMGHIEGSVFTNVMGPWDINIDAIVNIIDIVIVALAFDSHPGDDNWNPKADIAEAFGVVNIVDIVLVAIHFDESC